MPAFILKFYMKAQWAGVPRRTKGHKLSLGEVNEDGLRPSHDS